jgi:pimeloyl-ACP methyl ester carboxylesterase
MLAEHHSLVIPLTEFVVATRWVMQYALAGESGPPVVFVHGFGAFWQHWRDNIKSVAESGHRVFALTMLGFGRSEKPLITYTDLVWGELVRDFIVEVVREPAVVAGNSIGGDFAMPPSCLWVCVLNMKGSSCILS